MQRFHCNGWLNIYVTHGDNSRIRVRLSHDLFHPYPTHLTRHSKKEKLATTTTDTVQPTNGDLSRPDSTVEETNDERSVEGTIWLPPVVASSRLPTSINSDRVSLVEPS